MKKSSIVLCMIIYMIPFHITGFNVTKTFNNVKKSASSVANDVKNGASAAVKSASSVANDAIDKTF